jgi:hypothetical protein
MEIFLHCGLPELQPAAVFVGRLSVWIECRSRGVYELGAVCAREMGPGALALKMSLSHACCCAVSRTHSPDDTLRFVVYLQRDVNVSMFICCCAFALHELATAGDSLG